jgi:predicted Fe-S protein YdhL (DUF1289 family)
MRRYHCGICGIPVGRKYCKGCGRNIKARVSLIYAELKSRARQKAIDQLKMEYLLDKEMAWSTGQQNPIIER